MSKVLATGVTGYIGGHMFDHFVEAHPNEEYTIYGRSTEKLQKVKDAYPKVKISTVTGSLTDKDILEKAAYEAEIVFHWASADIEPAASAIVRGLSKRVKEGKTAFFVHTSGTGILLHAGGPHGAQVDAEFDDWDGVGKVTSIPHDAPHRSVDEIVLAGVDEGIKTAIVAPSLIYGVGRGKGNDRSMQLPGMAEITLKEGYAIKVNEGKSEWDAIHIDDLAKIYLGLFEDALKGGKEAAWGKKGYYFGASQRFVWGDLAQKVADYAYQKGYIKTTDVESVHPEKANKLSEGAGMLFGLTSKANAIRAKKVLGWNPTHPTVWEEIPIAVEIEAQRLGVERKYATMNTETVKLEK